MATNRKKLSEAKASAAAAAIEVLLDGTGHDDRLSEQDRNLFERAADRADQLAVRLRHSPAR